MHWKGLGIAIQTTTLHHHPKEYTRHDREGNQLEPMILLVLSTLCTFLLTLFYLLRRKYRNPWSFYINRRIVITGASSGIGEQLALDLAVYHPRLILTARRLELLDQVATKCLEKGAMSVSVISADMANEEDCISLVKECNRIFDGAIDMFILNAGVSMSRLFSDGVELKNCEHLFRVNVFGPMICVREAIPLLERCNGIIAVVSSMAGSMCPPRRTVYAASKAALNAFFESLYNERVLSVPRERHVNISRIYPPFVRTGIRSSHLDGGTSSYKEDKMMSVEECSSIIVDGLAEGKTEIYFDFLSRLGVALKGLFPSLVQFLVRKKVQSLLQKPDELNSSS